MFNISTSSKHILSALSMMPVQGHIQYGRLPKMCCICSSNYGSGLLVSKAHQREPVTDIWLPGLSACCSRPMVFVRSHRECITYSILTTCIVPNIPPTSQNVESKSAFCSPTFFPSIAVIKLKYLVVNQIVSYVGERTMVKDVERKPEQKCVGNKLVKKQRQ